MKTVIIYASVHHNNTKKIVDAIADEYGVDIIDAAKITKRTYQGMILLDLLLVFILVRCISP